MANSPARLGTITQTGGAITTSVDNFYIGWGAGATGNYFMHGGAMNIGDLRNDSGTATIYQDGGTVTSRSGFWVRLGMGASADGSYTLAGGTMNANDGRVNVGENGIGTLTIGGSNGGTMIVSPTAVVTVGFGTGSGTLNLQAGGLLQTPNVSAGTGATSAAFDFSGGTLENAPASNLAVTMPVNLSGSGTVDIDNGQTGTFNAAAAISGGGSLLKLGGGTLTLSGTHTYIGGTNVFDGTLVATEPQAIEDGTNLYVGTPGAFFAPVVPAPATTAVPEPGTLALLAAGTAVAFVAIRRKKRISRR